MDMMMEEKTEGRRDNYPLVSSLTNKSDGKETYSPTGERKRHSDKWVALQSSDRPAHEVRIDAPVERVPQSRATITQGTYLKQLNERMDKVIAAQAQAQKSNQSPPKVPAK